MPWFLFGSASLALLLALSILRRFSSPGALPFFGVLAGIVFYSAGYALELITPPGGPLPLWNHLEYLGVATLPAFWVWLSLEAARPDRISNPVVPVSLLLVPAITLVLNWTNDAHHLYYTRLEWVWEGGLTRAIVEGGPWYFVHGWFTLAAFVAGTVAFFITWKARGKGSRSPYLGILVATVPTVAAFLLYLSKVVSGGWDLVPLGLSVSGILYFWLLWPYRLFDLHPVTREAVFRLMPDPVLVVDTRGRLVDWNPAAANLFPSLGEPRLRPLVQGVFSTRPSWVKALDPLQDSPRAVLPLSEDGPSWWAVTNTPVVDRRGRLEARVFLLHEQTELVQRAEVYQQLALTDELTGCLNRRAFLERAAALVAARALRHEPVSLICIDLDHFKAINDTRGHAAGDAALKHAVGLWEGQLRAGDLLGRTGGEEFAVLLPGTRHEVGLGIAGRLCACLRDDVLAWGASEVAVTASFGVTGASDASLTNLETLLRNADAALYEAKSRGRNRVVLGCLSDNEGVVQACLEPD